MIEQGYSKTVTGSISRNYANPCLAEKVRIFVYTEPNLELARKVWKWTFLEGRTQTNSNKPEILLTRNI
jgi:hypothetical protein